MSAGPPIDQLHKALESRLRLGIMSALMVQEVASFNELKELLQTTDGNLASHLKALEAEQFITYSKSFAGRKPLTTYKATPLGKQAFVAHLNALEALIQHSRPPAS